MRYEEDRSIPMTNTTLLEMPAARARVSPVSVQEYHRLDELNQNARPTELIRGIIFEKMSKSPLHAYLLKWLYDWFNDQKPHGFVVRFDNPLTLADSEPEPDISIVRGRAMDFVSVHP